MEFDKVIIAGDDPESVLDEFIGQNIILIYPMHKKPSGRVLSMKNVEVLYSEFTKYPDIESLKVVRDILMYLLNSGMVQRDERVLFVFEKLGERYQIEINLSSLRYPTIVSLLRNRLSGELVEMLLRLSMSVVMKGREGHPVGAIFIVGDLRNVQKYVIQRISNPMRSIPPESRYILDESNIDSLREYATMDGAMLFDNRGYAMACGVYVKTLFVDEWSAHGLGGRHLAAMSISKLTRAVSFAISSEGTVRIYMDGKMIYELDGF